MTERPGTYFYIPFSTLDGETPRSQYKALETIYHFLREPPAEIPDEAVRIFANALFSNRTLEAHKAEIEDKLKSGDLIAHLMYKAKKFPPDEQDEIISYGIGIHRESLPSATIKADDWEVITQETCNQVKFY